MGNYSSRIKEIINANNLSVIDFCKLIGLNSPTTIHLMIKGKSESQALRQ